MHDRGCVIRGEAAYLLHAVCASMHAVVCMHVNNLPERGQSFSLYCLPTTYYCPYCRLLLTAHYLLPTTYCPLLAAHC